MNLRGTQAFDDQVYVNKPEGNRQSWASEREPGHVSYGSQGMCTFQGHEGSQRPATHQKTNDFAND